MATTNTTQIFTRAQDVPQLAWATLMAFSKAANVILPPLEKALERERSGHTNNSLVVVVSSRGATIEYILCIAEGYMGPYPVMIMTTIPPQDRDANTLVSNIHMLAEAVDSIPNIRRRVYSIFAVDWIARVFAEAWTARTGIITYTAPYYAAKITHCTIRTLSRRSGPVPSQYECRLATAQDIPGIAKLCFQFAESSFPFNLSREGANQEARILVENRLVWVLLASRQSGQPQEVACIAAYTRNSATVGAITKVFTDPQWRGCRLAQYLVHRVCEHLLTLGQKSSVVLYVAHNNGAARKVYHRVGFVGLEDTHSPERESPVEGVENWTEIGFEREKVTLGHW